MRTAYKHSLRVDTILLNFEMTDYIRHFKEVKRSFEVIRK